MKQVGPIAAITDTQKAPMMIASIDENCSLGSTVSALQTKTSSHLKWDFVETALIDEYNAKVSAGVTLVHPSKDRSSDNRKNEGPGLLGGVTSLQAKRSTSDESLDLDRTLKALSVAIKSRLTPGIRHVRSQVLFCDKNGHNQDR